MEPVFAPYNHCFGDCWAVLNHAIRFSIINKTKVWVSEYVCAATHMVPGLPSRGEFVGPLLREQLAEIKIPKGANIEIADKVVTEIRKITVEEFPYPYFQTKRKWSPGPYGRVCIQTDNSQIPDNCSRSFKYHDRKALYEWLQDKTHHIILGKPYTVAQCVDVASTSDLFIGMDSGMSHLAHSVGLPVILLDWVALDRFHPGKAFFRFQNAPEAIKLAERLLRDVSPWIDLQAGKGSD